MSQRLLFDEDSQWPAKIMRAVIWAGTMAAFWAAPFAIWVGFFAALFYLADTSKPRDAVELFAFFFIYMAWIPLVIGAATGLVAALYANPSEPFWGLRAPTFRTFFRDMILHMIMVALILGLLVQIGSEVIMVATPVIGFFYSLWRTCARNKQNAV